MKRILFFLIPILFFSCSKDDEQIKNSQEKQWVVTIKNKCEEDNTTVYTKYCVTESTSNQVLQEWVNGGTENVCEPISFTDINGTQVEGIIASTRSNLGACDDID